MSFLEKKTGEFVKKIEMKKGEPLHDMGIYEAREVLESLQREKGNYILEDVDIEDLEIINGISIRIVRPINTENKILPVVVYFHGGGWILGSKYTHDRLIRDIVVGAHVAVVFVNYTPAPEAKFPTQIEEGYDVVKYFLNHGLKYDVDGSRMAIMGDSAGGTIAAVIVLLCSYRDNYDILYQILLYPVTDANFYNTSYLQFANGPWLTRDNMIWFWDNYCPDVSKRSLSTVCPLQASIEELRNCPPTLIVTDENDVLRDEGEAYAHKLMSAGVTVTSYRCLGTIHDFMMLNELSQTPAVISTLEIIISKLSSLHYP